MAADFVLLATPCYGGLAKTVFMRSVLDLQAACVDRRLRLRVELGGGEALISRARAGALAVFLASEATHLLIVDADRAFAPADVFRLLAVRKEVAGFAAAGAKPGPGPTVAPGVLLVTRAAAEKIAAGFPELKASLRDVRGASAPEAPMVFDGLVEPGSGRYLADLDAFCHRWRALGGEVWTEPPC